VDFDFQQIDQRAAAREDAVAFEERLVLDDLEIKVLGQRIHEILIRHRRREFRLGADAFDGGGQHGLEPLALMPERLHLVGRYRL
jgi:hypothetical protein